MKRHRRQKKIGVSFLPDFRAAKYGALAYRNHISHNYKQGQTTHRSEAIDKEGRMTIKQTILKRMLVINTKLFFFKFTYKWLFEIIIGQNSKKKLTPDGLKDWTSDWVTEWFTELMSDLVCDWAWTYWVTDCVTDEQVHRESPLLWKIWLCKERKMQHP